MKKINFLKVKQLLIALVITVALLQINNGVKAQPTNYVKKVVLQGFWWDYWNSNYPFGWANYLTELAPRLKAAGIDAVWIPPAAKNSSPGSVGYVPFDHYDLGDKYQKGGSTRDSLPPNYPYLGTRTRLGTKDELLRLIAVLHANGIEVVEDMVLNHNADAGANNGGIGGQDVESTYSAVTASGFKNFRYVSYKTPVINESLNDYYTRAGRWSKNYQNYHPNPANNCTGGDICGTFWGPDIDYASANAIGKSSNIPTSGDATINGITRPFYNPVQTTNYMNTNVREMMKWFVKQTGVDGFRFDAVKHFDIPTQKDYILDVKYNLPAWAAGGQNMLNFAEWVSGASDLDGYVANVARGRDVAGPVYEEHTGAFDFSLRGYSGSGGLYSMVLGQGSFNMQALPGGQQSKRYFDYTNNGIVTRVYRTVPFLNSHDTFRPKLDTAAGKIGNYSKPLGDNTGWDMGNELGGNGAHIDPREPRLAAGYAALFAMDGNPTLYIEDLFDLGTTGKRYSHIPTSEADLPVRKDLQNITQAHQKLGFKDATYGVSTAITGTNAPAYTKGSSADHLVIERAGKVIIGITDAYSSVNNNTSDQEVYVTVDAALVGKNLIDYSGAHGVTTSTVFNDRRVLIKTAPNGHTIADAYGHGYSIWAPIPDGVTFTTVQDIYNYLASYQPSRNTATTQEWEMADDLGDSHCKSLGQGGKLPDNSTNERIAGRIFSDINKQITVKILPEIDGRDVTATIYNNKGEQVGTVSGATTVASPITVTYTPTAAGWYSIKVRNTQATNAGQKVWVNVNYTAPTVVDTRSAATAIATNVSIWTGNKGTTDVSDCGNWEGGLVPTATSNVFVYGHTRPFPILTFDLTVNKVNLFTGATLTVNPNIKLTILSQ